MKPCLRNSPTTNVQISADIFNTLRNVSPMSQFQNSSHSNYVIIKLIMKFLRTCLSTRFKDFLDNFDARIEGTCYIFVEQIMSC